MVLGLYGDGENIAFHFFLTAFYIFAFGYAGLGRIFDETKNHHISCSGLRFFCCMGDLCGFFRHLRKIFFDCLLIG